MNRIVLESNQRLWGYHRLTTWPTILDVGDIHATRNTHHTPMHPLLVFRNKVVTHDSYFFCICVSLSFIQSHPLGSWLNNLLITRYLFLNYFFLVLRNLFSSELGWWDLNPRTILLELLMPESKSGALPLGDSPLTKYFPYDIFKVQSYVFCGNW